MMTEQDTGTAQSRKKQNTMQRAEVLIVHDFFEFGELPLEHEDGRVAELSEWLHSANLMLVQGYNDSAGYYLVEWAEVDFKYAE